MLQSALGMVEVGLKVLEEATLRAVGGAIFVVDKRSLKVDLDADSSVPYTDGWNVGLESRAQSFDINF
jgi:hypothetical protein